MQLGNVWTKNRGDTYLLSLEVIANAGEDRRREKAQGLHDNYKKASMSLC
jgi:hypothetical protein